jgi:sugar phosphate isomerase/epimerase
MKLGFVSAILPDLLLEDVLAFAAAEGFACVEAMCWPTDASDRRRYAGVTHIDVSAFGPADAERIRALQARYGVEISGLGYYPNPLAADAAERDVTIAHIRRVIDASALLGIGVMNTFVGRDPARSIEDQWPLFEQVWTPLIAYAEERGVRVGIENCPMLFSHDEWPGGKNLAISPEVWERMFTAIESDHFGLNFDPSHLVWQGIDHLRAMREWHHRFVHVHIKDERVNHERLHRRGNLGLGWHDPKIPGLGDIDWTAFLRTLSEVGYDGAVCIEVEDRAFEDSLEGRKRAIRESKRHIDLALEKG